MKIGFSVLNYTNHQDTRECVLSLLRALAEDDYLDSCRVIIRVVDNCSPNDSFDHILKFVGQQHLSDTITLEAFQTEKNLGFAGGHNVALHDLFMVHHCDFVFIVNNDLIVHHVDIRELVNNLKTFNNAIFGVFLQSYNQEEIPGGSTFFKNTFMSVPSLRSGPHKLQSDAALCYVSGAFLGLDKKLFTAVGGLSEENFLYFEELDYCFKAKTKLGTFPDAVFLPLWIVDHKVGGSTGNNRVHKSQLAEYYSARGRVCFAKKCLPRFIINAVCYNLALSMHRTLKFQFINGLTIIRATFNALTGERGIKSEFHR